MLWERGKGCFWRQGKDYSTSYGGDEQDVCGGKMRGKGNARGMLAIKTKRQGVEEEDVDAEEEVLFKEAEEEEAA
jgi:hypothetical protein